MAVWILSSSIVIFSLLIIRIGFKKWISPSLRYSLWILVLVRLLIPFSVGENALSAENIYRELPKWSSQMEENLMREQVSRDLSESAVRDSLVSEEKYQNLSERIPESQKVSGIRILRMIWGIGSISVGSILLLSNLHFYHRLRKSRRRIDITEIKIPVYVTDVVASPCLFGFPFPSIYLMKETVANDAIRKYVLAHEITHYRNGDYIFAFLRCVCLTLHWFNPLVWIAAGLSRQDCELACDERTVRRLGEEERFGYGKALLALASSERSAVLFAASGAVSQSKSQIADRIHVIASNRKTKVAALILLIPMILVCVMIGYTGIKSDHILESVSAPDYVKEAALAWAEVIVDNTESAVRRIYESADAKIDPIAQERIKTTDWRISDLTSIGVTSPVCGREIEIWSMEMQTYSKIAEGDISEHWSYCRDGSGWTTSMNANYMVFDAQTKEELWRYSNWSEDAAHDSAVLMEMIANSMRFYENTENGDRGDAKNIAGMHVQLILHILKGEADDLYHYVDGVCYKLESDGAVSGKYGREETWTLIVNETGEKLGSVVYYPQYNDIALLDGGESK